MLSAVPGAPRLSCMKCFVYHGILVFLNALPSWRFGKPGYVMVRRLPNSFAGDCSAYFNCSFVYWYEVHVPLREILDPPLISFIKTLKYTFTVSLSSHFTITNSFGKLASWQTSFRKKTRSYIIDPVKKIVLHFGPKVDLVNTKDFCQFIQHSRLSFIISAVHISYQK